MIELKDFRSSFVELPISKAHASCSAGSRMIELESIDFVLVAPAVE